MIIRGVSGACSREVKMPEEISITARNKLITEKLDQNVCHHSKRSAYIISHGNSITIPLGTIEDNKKGASKINAI
jgi:hypothetical protein